MFLFQFRGAVCRWVSRSSRQADKKCGNLDSCSKSQSFFAGINLVQAGSGNSGGGGLAAGGGGGGDKSQTLTTSLPDSARVSSLLNFILQRGTGTQHYLRQKIHQRADRKVAASISNAFSVWILCDSVKNHMKKGQYVLRLQKIEVN